MRRRCRRRDAASSRKRSRGRSSPKWPWKDTPAPRDLREAFTHPSRPVAVARRSARRGRCSCTGRGARHASTAASSSRAEIHRLEAIRDQMHISQTDHERIMAELAEEDLADTGRARRLAGKAAAARDLRPGARRASSRVSDRRRLTLDDAGGARRCARNTRSPRKSTPPCSTGWSAATKASRPTCSTCPVAIEMACVAMEHARRSSRLQPRGS